MSETPNTETASAVPDFERNTQKLPDETSIAAAELLLFYSPPGTLRMTVQDNRSYHTIKLFQSAPLSRPGQYISLQSGRNEEILMLRDLKELQAESRKTVEEEMQRRYLTARIQKIIEVKTEFGVTYWHVETDRGPRDFVIQSMSESCQWLNDDHILLTDNDGNRFEIVNRSEMDEHSQKQLDSVA